MDSRAHTIVHRRDAEASIGVFGSIFSFLGKASQTVKKGKLEELSSELRTLGNAWRWVLNPKNKKLLGNLSKVEILDLYSRFSYSLEYNGGISGDEGKSIPGASSFEGLDYLLDQWMEVNPENRNHLSYDQLKSEASYAAKSINAAMLGTDPVGSIEGLGPLGTRWGVLEDRAVDVDNYAVQVGTLESPNNFEKYLESRESRRTADKE